MSRKTKFWSAVLVFFAAMLWATDSPFRLYVTEELPSAFIVLVEHFFSLLILLPFLFKALPKLKTLSSRSLISLLVIGCGSSALALILFTESFHYMNPSAAIILQKLQPFFAILLAHIMLKEKLGKWFWPLSLLAVFGAYLISFPGFVPSSYPGEIWSAETFGVMLALGAAILWGAGTVLGRVSLSELTFQDVTSLRFFVGFIFLALWNIATGDIGLAFTLSPKSLLFLFIMSMVSGAVGLFIYYRGLRDTKASVATIAELGFVVAAVLVNFFFIKAALLPMQIVGMIIVLLAVLMLAQRQAEQEI